MSNWEPLIAAFTLGWADISPEMQNNVDLVVATIYAEARGEGREGMLAVLSVMQTRSRLKRKPLKDIVIEPHQFAVPRSVREMLQKMPQSETAFWRKAVICTMFFDQDSMNLTSREFKDLIKWKNIIENHMMGATHFYQKGKTPEKFQESPNTVVIRVVGGHVFWKEHSY